MTLVALYTVRRRRGEKIVGVPVRVPADQVEARLTQMNAAGIDGWARAEDGEVVGAVTRDTTKRTSVSLDREKLDALIGGRS